MKEALQHVYLRNGQKLTEALATIFIWVMLIVAGIYLSWLVEPFNSNSKLIALAEFDGRRLTQFDVLSKPVDMSKLKKERGRAVLVKDESGRFVAARLACFEGEELSLNEKTGLSCNGKTYANYKLLRFSNIKHTTDITEKIPQGHVGVILYANYDSRNKLIATVDLKQTAIAVERR